MSDPASEYNAAVAALDSRIIILRERIHKLYGEATSLGARPSGDGGRTGPSDRVGAQVARIVDAEQELQRLCDAKEALEVSMIRLIDTIGIPDERTVLTLRVVYRIPHEQAARTLGKSERQEYRIYKRALNRLAHKTGTAQYSELRKKMSVDVSRCQ